MKLTCREAAIFTLTVFLFGVVGILSLTHDGGFLHFMGEVHDAFWDFIHGLVKIALILLGIGVFFGSAYIALLLHREFGVVRPGKYGKVQAVKRWRKDPFLLPQEGEHPLQDMQLMYKVMQEYQRTLALQYKALESQQKYERTLPPPQQTVVESIPAGSLQDHLHISDQYQFHVNELLSHRGLLTGTSGAGKSFTSAVILEELLRPELAVPFVTFDTDGEYIGIPRFMGRGMALNAAHLGVEEAEDFGTYVIKNHEQVVIDLSSYPTGEEAARVMCGVLTGIRRWEEERANEVRVAIMTFLTEAHKWLPQYASEQSLPPEVSQLMQLVFFADLVRRGRKQGMGFILDTQKLAEIDKRALQPDWMICLRQMEDRAIKRYETWGITQEEATSLKDGQGFIFSKRVRKFLAKMRMRRSPDAAKSPGIESIRQHEPERDTIWTPRQAAASFACSRPQTLEERVMQAWENGHQGVREIERELGISYYQAQKACKKLGLTGD